MKSYLEHAKDIALSAQKSFLGRVLLSFSKNGGTDAAAGLTYYLVFSFVPLILAAVSLLGILGLSQYLLDNLLPVLEQNISAEVFSIVKEPLLTFRDFGGIGITFVIGIISMAWSASNYLSGFGRALDKIQNTKAEDVQNSILVRLRMLVLTLILLILLVVATGFFMMSEQLLVFLESHLDKHIVTLLSYIHLLRAPVILLCFIVVLALLYFATPSDFSLRHRKKGRAFFPGASIALILVIAVVLGFSYFVSNFGKYDAVYGTLAGVIITLLLFWIINCMLLLGAEINHQIDINRGLKEPDAQEQELLEA